MTFGVKLLPSGHSYEVGTDTSLLTAGLAAGMLLPYSCRQGSCGTCRARIVAGKVGYGEVMPAYLSEDGRARGELLMCQATARSDLIIEVEELAGLAGLKPRHVPCRIVAIQRPSDNAAILTVRLPMNENFRFAGGQYVEFVLADGSRRPFSIATPPTAEGVTELEFHLAKLATGKFTDYIFESARLRELLRFEGPLGTFFIREGEGPIILCATGTGYSSIQAMLGAAFASRLHERRPISFYWGGRTGGSLYALEQVRGWVRQYPQFRFHPVLSRGQELSVPEARTGYIQDAVLADHGDLSNSDVYACGSPAMVGAARAAFVAQDLRESRFFSDEHLPALARTPHVAM